jgi:hypothetical protein
MSDRYRSTVGIVANCVRPDCDFRTTPQASKLKVQRLCSDHARESGHAEFDLRDRLQMYIDDDFDSEQSAGSETADSNDNGET